MARYVANIEKGYKQPIPYHFTCNYCGEVNQKTYEIFVSVKAHGSARDIAAVQEAADRQHDRQVDKNVREKNREIAKYRQKLIAGEAVTDRKLWSIALNSECARCGRRQMWNPGMRPGIKVGHMEPIGAVGLIAGALGFIGAFFSFFFLLAQGVGVPPAVPCALLGVAVLGFILYRVGSAIDDRKDAAWFRENLAGEPNDPDKLPVIDK